MGQPNLQALSLETISGTSGPRYSGEPTSTRVIPKPAAPTTAAICKLLLESPLGFNLGGSRKMAKIAAADDLCHVAINISKDTDFDFYATNSTQAYEFLAANGFYEKTRTNKEYLDDEATGVFEHNSVFPKVQVVLRRDADFYKSVFESITPAFYYDFLWKSSDASSVNVNLIQSIFNQLFKTARSLNG